jgi:hypothetical protein
MTEDTIMAFERDPSELAQTDAELRRNQMLDNQLQPDPELAEGPAGGGRIALFAIAVIAILGVVLYGLNSSTPTNTAANPPAQSTANSSSNTPNAMSPSNPNTNPGQTTGTAPANPQPSPPSSGSNAPASPRN